MLFRTITKRIFLKSYLQSIEIIDFETADNGQEAIDQLLASKNRPFQIVFMDINMPVMDGPSAAVLAKGFGYAGPKMPDPGPCVDQMPDCASILAFM